jgi:hypothetical protein
LLLASFFSFSSFFYPFLPRMHRNKEARNSFFLAIPQPCGQVLRCRGYSSTRVFALPPDHLS